MRLVRILLAEDNEDHLFLIVRALRDMEGVRLEIDAVRDGAEALDYINRRGRFEARPRPHLIILDLKMPKVSGFEVIESIKKDPELRTIPIVVLTASDRDEDVEASYDLGANSYVVKPSTPAGLREGLQELSGYWTALASLPEPPQ